MPSYTQQQISQIELLAKEIQPTLNELHDFVFGFNDGDIIKYELASFTSKVGDDQRCFKPANTTLQADSRYWRNQFFELERVASNSSGTISVANANKFIDINIKFAVWCDLVIRAYLSEDLPAYHNKITYTTIRSDLEEAFYGNLFSKTTEIIEPTTTLTQNSEICEYWDGEALRTIRGFFRPQEHQENMRILKQKSITIKDYLGAPTLDPVEPLEPIQVERSGTNKLLKSLGDIFSFLKESFSSVNRDIAIISGHSEDLRRSIHDLRSVEIKSARLILQDLRGEFALPTVSTQTLKYSIDRLQSLQLIGSEGGYYPKEVEYFPASIAIDKDGLPIDPQSGDSLNIVRLSKDNGIIFSLKRADENAQIRYLRINDSLFEASTGISLMKPLVEEMNKSTTEQGKALSEILAKIKEIKLQLDRISERI